MYSATDIEIFILTYNRSNLLSSTLRSIVDQIVKGVRVCVLDNGSTDETSDVIRPFLSEGVEYFRNDINDHLGAWSQIKNFASRSWIMVFHDDDLLHPDYIATVLNVINMYPGIALVGSGMAAFRWPVQNNWDISTGTSHYYCKKYSDLAYLLFNGFPMPFCSAVYRTDVFRKLQINSDVYGKVFDRPFMMDASRYGGAVILRGKYVRARIHPEQDSRSIFDGSFVRELISLNKYYFVALGQNLFTRSGRLFLLKNYSRLVSAYNWLGKTNSGLTKTEFMKLAVKEGAATEWSIKLGGFYEFLFVRPYRLFGFLIRRFKSL